MYDTNQDVITPRAAIFDKIVAADPAAAQKILEAAEKAQQDYLASKHMKLEEGQGFAVSVRNALRKTYNATVNALCAEEAVVDVAQYDPRASYKPFGAGPRILVVNEHLAAAMRDHLSDHAELVQSAGITPDEILLLNRKPYVPLITAAHAEM